METTVTASVPKVLQYDQLDNEAKARVDEKVKELRNAGRQELLVYGLETQSKVTQYANNMLTKISAGSDVESIDDIINEVLDVSKPFMGEPQKENFLTRLGRFVSGEPKEKPRIDRSMFAGKVEKLVENIEMQTGRLIADNIMYDDFIELLITNVTSVNESIIALQMYMAELSGKQKDIDRDNSQVKELILKKTEGSNALEQLQRKLNMFMISRQESMQVAVSARIIQNNNVVLSDRLQTLLVVAVPILQNQILLKASMQDTQRGLDICDKVSASVDAAMRQNAEQLKTLTARIGSTGETLITGESVAEMSKSLFSIADELKSVNSKAKEDLGKMREQIDQSDANLQELFNQLS